MDNIYLNKIKSFYDKQKRMPSYGELAKLLGFKSRNAAYKLADRLIKAGVLSKDSAGRLRPSKLFQDTKVLGVIEAGFPSPAEEELIDTLSLDDFLIRNKSATYILEVTGQSMIDAGIMPGDMVLVERGKDPKEGDIVIAEVDSKWTMKYYRKIRGRVCLVPANRRYKTIYPEEELNIAAIVIAVIRKYQK
ncbi:transcriptional repressor LexA [Patescibacteria group bacterium]